jgi:hypothetical protein
VTAGDPAPRRAAVSAQLDALSEHELRTFLAYLTGIDVSAIEVPLASFLAVLAASRAEAPPRVPATAATHEALGCGSVPADLPYSWLAPAPDPDVS